VVKSLITFVGVISLAVLSGCTGRYSFEARKEFAIQFEQRVLASTTNRIQVKWRNDILSALASTDSKTVKSVKLVTSFAVERTNDTFGLYAWWIEMYPSVDGVELRFNDQQSPAILLTSEIELTQNKQVAVDTIVFGNEFEWQDLSTLNIRWNQITNSKNVEIRLLRTKMPVTDWVPVDIYRANERSLK
jgi:hypothetical protein